MSVNYMDDISNGQGILVFLKILFRWRGSLYKLVWLDLLIYISIYSLLNLSYRFAMNDAQKQLFEGIVEFCDDTKGDIPISFLLGFFVAGIIGRWYHMYMYIPWLNEVALHVSNSVTGRDEEGARKVRVTIMRYINLSWILMMRLISDQIATRFSPLNADGDNESTASQSHHKRPHKTPISRNTSHPWSIDSEETHKTTLLDFNSSNQLHVKKTAFLEPLTPNSGPTAPIAMLEDDLPYSTAFRTKDDPDLREDLFSFNRDSQVHRTFGKLITDSEVDAFQHIATEWFNRTKTKYKPEYWIPIQWAQRVVLKAVQSGYICDPKTAYYLIGQIGELRKQMQDLQIFSSIMIPLVYTQVVIIAVYSYFMCQIFASQFVESRDEKKRKIDMYIPIFSIFTFLFLMGWLKVALCVMNPFGEDDEDFQTSSILDYNLEVSFRSVYLDNGGFPKFLGFPLGKKIPEGTEDDLEKFLDPIDCELNKEMMENANEKNVHNLEMRQTPIGRCRSMFCCQKTETTTPTMDLKLTVTNAEHRTSTEAGRNRQSSNIWN